MYEMGDADAAVDYNGRSVRQAFDEMRGECPGCVFLLGEFGYLHSQPEFAAAFRCILEESLNCRRPLRFRMGALPSTRQEFPAFGAFTMDRRITPLGDLLRSIDGRPAVPESRAYSEMPRVYSRYG